MRRTTTFSHGSGCYACGACGRKTRDDGHGDSVHLRLCTQCFELGGLENEVSDYGPTHERLARIAELQAEIVERGGRRDED